MEIVESFLSKLFSNKPTFTLEITPPKGVDLDEVIEKIKKSNVLDKIDGFSVTDNPLAKLKASTIVLANLVQSTFNKPVLTTFSMRDKNKLALQSELLGANYLNLRLILALTGDSAKFSDQPNVKGVFEGNSNLLLNIIECFNNGIDYGGKELKSKPKRIYPIVVSNSYSKNFNVLKKKMVEKLNNGAVAIITQPVYEKEILLKLLDIFEEAKKEAKFCFEKATLIVGFFPITKLKTAQFLSSRVPGIFVPKYLVEELIEADDEEKRGFEISLNILKTIISIHPKVHLMSANRFELISKLLLNTIS